MCDERTEAENERWLLARRDVTLMGAGAALAMMVPACASGTSPDQGSAATASRKVSITTPDGTADGFFVYPAKGRHPAVILWPDIASLRSAYEIMATRLAGAGYAVLVVNPYYRSAPAPIFASFAEWRTEAGQAKLQPMRAALTPEAITRDAGAFVDWLDRQAQVDTTRKIGSAGYCMGGPFALRTAAARPERVGAAASFHGAGLVTGGPYAVVRHPQYLGIFIGLTGFTLLGARPIAVVAWVTAVCTYLALMIYEESENDRRFGDRYRAYRDRAPFIIPFFPRAAARLLAPVFALPKSAQYVAVAVLYVTLIAAAISFLRDRAFPT